MGAGLAPGAVKHATTGALAGMTPLLEQIRSWAGIREKTLGVFYRRSRPFLHFHEDPAGLFADLNTGAQFERFPVNTPDDWDLLLAAIDRTMRAVGQ